MKSSDGILAESQVAMAELTKLRARLAKSQEDAARAAQRASAAIANLKIPPEPFSGPPMTDQDRVEVLKAYAGIGSWVLVGVKGSEEGYSTSIEEVSEESGKVRLLNGIVVPISEICLIAPLP